MRKGSAKENLYQVMISGNEGSMLHMDRRPNYLREIMTIVTDTYDIRKLREEMEESRL